MNPAEIIIDPAFKAAMPPLTEEERAQLESNIVANGCRDPIVVWSGHGIILDGHNRYEICTRHDLRFNIAEIDLVDRAAAEDWIDANQLGRRNLSPDQRALILGRRYNRQKRRQGGTGANQYMQTDQTDTSATADKLAAEHGVSAPTVKRAGAFADAVEKVKTIDPDIERKVTQGSAPPRASVVKAARLLESNPEKAAAVLNGDISAADAIRDERRQAVREQLESVEEKAAKAVIGVYDVIVIDPPWPMEKIERDVREQQAGFDYPTMGEDDLQNLSIPCADDCHLWLWTTQKFLPLALRLLDAWSLKYVCTFVWHKPGGFQPFGLPQYNCEFALYARRGSPEFLDTKAFSTAFDAPRGSHSEKPEEFYSMVRRVTAGRRLDMFNRRNIDGFDGWGNESA